MAVTGPVRSARGSLRRLRLPIVFAIVAVAGRARADAVPSRLLFLGDILLSRNVAKERNERGQSPWAGADFPFRRADWVMGNFEGAVGRPEQCAADTTGLCFAVPDSLLDDLRDAGIGALSLANNHALDLGPEGLSRSRKALAAHGLRPIDFDGSPFFRRFGERTVAFVGLSMIAGKDGGFQAVPGAPAARKLRLARNFSDRVVVFIHWGTELQDWPNGSQLRAARWLAAQGADLIIGAHPHVVQEPVCAAGAPVFYSLGNHLFDQKYPETKRGLIADCLLRDSGFACRSRWTRSGPEGFFPRPAPDGDTTILQCPDSQEDPGRPRGGDDGRFPMRLESVGPADSARYRWYAAATPDKQGGDGRRIVWEGPAPGILSASPFRLKQHPGKAFLFRLERHFSTLDKEAAPRPYVYEVGPNGLIARWRGSGLAWPLLDAEMLPENEDGILCALHRGDSFLAPDPAATGTRLAAYRWNGFGFTLLAQRFGAPKAAPGSETPVQDSWIKRCGEVLEPSPVTP
jgi:hypothetical protein